MNNKEKLNNLLKAATGGNWDIGDICCVTGYQHHKYMNISDVLEMAIEDGLYFLVLDSLEND